MNKLTLRVNGDFMLDLKVNFTLNRQTLIDYLAYIISEEDIRPKLNKKQFLDEVREWLGITGHLFFNSSLSENYQIEIDANKSKAEKLIRKWFPCDLKEGK